MHPIHGILPLIPDASHGRPGDGHGRAGIHLVTGTPKGKVAMGQTYTSLDHMGQTYTTLDHMEQTLLYFCVYAYCLINSK